MEIIVKWGLTWSFLAIVDLVLFLKRYDIEFKNMVKQLRLENIKMYLEFFVLAPFIFLFLIKTNAQK